MIRGLFRFIFGVLAFVGRSVEFLGRALVTLVFLLAVGAIVAVMLRPAPEVPDGAALVLRPAGAMVEQAVLGEPFELLTGGSPAGQAVLGDLLEAVRSATSDARIAALVIETDDLAAAGLSKLGELRAAITAFKAAGKPVYARGERFTQSQYYLASVADEIHLAPDGFVLLQGLARYVTYFKDALDALGVRIHVFRVGEYKSFSEPFTRSDMSEQDRDASRDLLDALWDRFRTDVSAARKLSPEALDAYVQGYRDVLAASRGDAAEAARTAGLIDQFSTRDQWRARLLERVGKDAEGKDVRAIDADTYLVATRAKREQGTDQVAVVVAQGAIMDGEHGTGVVGGDTFARILRAVREDDAVKAVVLRIDSPGGSAFASEVIRRELELTRAAGKPVIASMSSVAASGGYWIAAGGDEIWAAPATLTGSIGIFAMFPEFSEPLRRLGIGVDGVATAPLAGALDPRRPLAPAAAEAMQFGIEHGYRRFLEIVAKARGMTVDEVDKVARGRVWTGEAAAELGLVDKLGGLDAAVAAAAARAGLSDYKVVWPEAAMSLRQRLLQRFMHLAESWSPRLQPAEGALAGLLTDLQASARSLLLWNDPRHIYAHCLCEAP